MKREANSSEEVREAAGKKRNRRKAAPVCYRVCFNTGLEVCFFADEVYEYHFYEEAELRNPFDVIMTRILFRRLLAGVLPFVVFTKRTEFQVRQRAEQVPCGEEPVWRHFKASALEMLMDYLRDERYVDDMRYAEVYVRNQMQKETSRRAMIAELTRRGISADRAEEAVSAANPDETERAKALLLKKLNGMKVLPGTALSVKEKGKLYRFLSGKGFRSETIRAVMESCAIDEDGGEMDASI